MNDQSISVTLVCLFCGANLDSDDNPEPMSGDLIKCRKCGEKNDYDSLLEVAKEKGVKEIKRKIESELKREFKGLFKKQR